MALFLCKIALNSKPEKNIVFLQIFLLDTQNQSFKILSGIGKTNTDAYLLSMHLLYFKFFKYSLSIIGLINFTYSVMF